MIKKRTFILLPVLLIAILFTFPMLTVQANAQTVTYNRRQPEAAILNRYTGGSAKFYDTLFSDSSPYNAIRLFELNYSSRVTPRKCEYVGYPESTLREVSKAAYQNLKANVSGTFHNNWHTHTGGTLGLQQQKVLAYSSLYFYMNDRFLQGLQGIAKYNEENARLGNRAFNTVPYTGNGGAILEFTQSSVKYNNEKSICTCKGHYVEKIVLAFMDDRSPICGPARYVGPVQNGIFKENDEIKIEIPFDEPIRFADDNPVGKENLYIRLIISGRTVDAYPKAMLTKLDDRTLTFSYTVPEDFGTETITGLDLSPLLGSNIDLVQVKGSGNFTVGLPADVGGNAMGFTKTTSYITDLAGNPITVESARFSAYINTGTPYATKFRVYAYADNSDVKRALGKTDPEDKDYLDNSDNYLGVGDWIKFAIEFNEILDIEGLDYGITDYGDLMMQTNLVRGGQGIALSSLWACEGVASGDQYGQGASKGAIAYIEAHPLWITEDMTCSDVDGRIRITGIYFKDGKEPFINLAGKPFDVSTFHPEELPMPAYYLDNTLPTVSTTAEETGKVVDDEPVYQITTEGDGMGFRFPFEISDGKSGSGTNGILGYFFWYKYSIVGDQYITHFEGLPFEYTVTSQPALTGNEEWQAGKLRTATYFTQIEGTQYLHLRPIPGEVYDIFESGLVFYVEDYAGNSKRTIRHGDNFFINGIWDNSPPTAALGAVSRKMETGGGGTITVGIKLEDQTALKEAYYLWNDGTEPSEDNDSWQPAIGNIEGEKSGTVTAMAEVASEEDFSRHLWFKASDGYGNVLIKYFGAFEYKLSIISHEVSYPSEIINSASLEIVSIDSGGKILFMVPIPGTDHDYFVRIFEDPLEDIFSDENHSDWARMPVTREEDKYVFGNIIGDGSFQKTFVGEGGNDPTFSGNLHITALCGQSAAFNDLLNVGAFYPVSVDNITLRLASSNPDSPDAYTGMSIKADREIDSILTYTNGYYKVGEKMVLSSPETVVFAVYLGTDVNGWNFEDIDFDDSYIKLENREDGEIFKAYLSPNIRQDVVFPKDDYTTGWYSVNLIMNSKLGKGYKWGLWGDMYIDATAESKDFGIKSLTYRPDERYKDKLYKHGMEERDYFDPYDEVLYLPANYTGSALPPNILTVAVNDIEQYLNDYDNKGNRGVYGVRAWNVTAGVDEEEAEFTYRGNRGAGEERSFYLTLWDTGEEAALESGTVGSDMVGAMNCRTKIGLVKNTVNTIGIQVVNANGKTSSINYYNIHPIEWEIEGALSATRGAGGSNVVAYGELKFTPNEGQSMDGVQLYAAACQYDSTITVQSYINIDTMEMLPQSDGSYIRPLIPGETRYFCYAVDALDNIMLSPAKYTDAVADNRAPEVAAINEECKSGEGKYEAAFTIRDETLSAYNAEASGKAYVLLPMTINLHFDEDHGKWLGLDEDEGLGLTVNQVDYKSTWRAEAANSAGIYEVEVDRKSEKNSMTNETEYYLTVKIKGQVGYREGEGARNFDLIMDATDAFGNKGTGTAHFENAENIKPRAYDSGENNGPLYEGGYDKTLRLNFNMPVMPTPSWINPNPIYGELQIDAFPITQDGTWEIAYSDMFGIVYTQKLTLNDVFGIYGLTIDINPSSFTGDDVEFTASTLKDDSEGVLLLFRDYGNQIVTVQSPDYTHNTPLKEKYAVLTENQTLVLYRYSTVYSYAQLFEQQYYSRGDKWKINITNIGKAAPEAVPRFYFEAKGEEYAKDKVPAGETSGNVKVWYKTSRHVTPTGDTGESFIFKYGSDVRSHLFTYVDDFGHEGSLNVNLGSLGVELTEPPKPYEDINPPMVTVRLYAKRSGSYEEKESFGHWSTSDDITDAFDAVCYVQGYSMKIEVNDESDYKIVILNTDPSSGLSYESAKSDSIEGVTLSGNTVTITKPTDLTVAAVDNAKSESAAEKDNCTYFSLKAADMAKWFDTTAPKAEKEEIADSLYKRTIYISLSDKADNDEDTNTAALVSPKLDKETTGMYENWYKRTFTDNSSEHLVFKDLAGNVGTLDITMAGIDTDEPILETIWSPPYISGDPPKADLSNFTWGPVNTDVTGIVKSSKPIENVEVEYSGDGETWTDWDPAVHENANVDVSPERITVKFSESGVGIRLTVTAPNGKSTVEKLFLEGNVIDKDAPIITPNLARQYLDGFDAPYAIKIILTPNEPVYCLNAGKAGTLYDSGKPIIVTTNQNTTNTYLFADKAGNRTDVTVTTDDIDFTPPTLAMEPEDTSGLEITSGSAEVDITADEACTLECAGSNYNLAANIPETLSFDKNGVYLITAADSAGNNAYAVVTIGNIDKTAPTISFDRLTVGIRQGSSLPALGALLGTGVNVRDNLDSKDKLLWDWDVSGVEMEEIGLYEVLYTVTDTAGNEGTATRYVRVFDKNIPGITIDNVLTEQNGTSAISAGEHVLKVEGLKEITPGDMEPYTLKICKGLMTEGQAKYFPSAVTIDPDGKFTIEAKGFYTVYLITQSRQSYRTLLYVER